MTDSKGLMVRCLNLGQDVLPTVGLFWIDLDDRAPHPTIAVVSDCLLIAGFSFYDCLVYVQSMLVRAVSSKVGLS